MRRSIRIAASAAMALLLCLALGMAAPDPGGGTLQYGDTGPDVEKVQSRLRQWGYYTGAVDGVFGTQTQDAVIFFQQRNGITPDGIVGPYTANAIGITIGNGGGSYTPSGGGMSSGDLYLLARVVYGEARGEPYAGKVAVAAVVLNRVDSGKFPTTIAGVVYQPGAFDAVSDGQINLTPDEESVRAARDAMNGWDPSGGAIYYYNPSTATSAWIWSRPIIAVIGGHNFAA
jgi:N-acetylmuramoyl-L-alanine amidase